MDFDEVWMRVCLETGWKKYSELADFLDIKSSSVSGAKSRGIFPLDWAFKIAQKFDLSTDWLMVGRKPKGGEPTPIDEGFFVLVASAVDAVLEGRELDLPSQTLLRLYIFLYESCIDSKTIDPRMVGKIISLVAPDTFVLEADSDVSGLIDRLVMIEKKKYDGEIQELIIKSQWLKKVADKFNAPGLLIANQDRKDLIAWLERQLENKATGNEI